MAGFGQLFNMALAPGVTPDRTTGQGIDETGGGDWFAQFGGSSAPDTSTQLGQAQQAAQGSAAVLQQGMNQQGGGLSWPPPWLQENPDGTTSVKPGWHYSGGDFGHYVQDGASGLGGGPAGGGDPWQTFESIVGIGGPGASLSPQQLLAKENELKAAGITLIKNAAGIPGKIQFTSGPNAGQAFDVIQGAGAGQNIYQRLPLGNGSGGGGNMGGFGALNFNSPYQTFNAPDPNTFFQLPWVQAAIGQADKGIERSAAAKGTLLTGGTLQRLRQNDLTMGPSLYSQAFGQALQGNQANFGNELQTNQTNYGNLYNLAGLGIKGAGA